MVRRQFTVLCRKPELFGGKLLAIEGSKFKAVNAGDKNFNAEKLKELIGHSNARLVQYLQKLDGTDEQQSGSGTMSKKRNDRKKSRRWRKRRSGT